MSNPFATFSVTPTYGSFRAVIDYKLAPGVGGDIYFYRSFTGTNDWSILNPGQPMAAAAGQFADSDLVADFSPTVYYRGLVDPGGGEGSWLPGPAVAPFEQLLRRQRLGAAKILKLEYKAMAGRKSDGTRVWYYIPITDGETVTRFDAETGQLLGPDCPGSAEDGFGTPFKGGFLPPLQTWVRILSAAPMGNTTPAEATRTDEKADMIFRLLAHPRPREGHMIVMPLSDQRYVLKDPITPFYFPGTTVPIAWEAPARLLYPTDARQRIVPPPIEPDPTYGP